MSSPQNLTSVLPIHKIEESNRRLQEQNTVLHKKLMKIVHGKDSKHLSAQTEQRRKELEEQRILKEIERAVDLTTKEESLKSAVKSVHSGRDEKQLSSQVETKRKQLASGRHEKAATISIDLKQQQLQLNKLLSKVQKGRDDKALSDEIESKRKQLADERRRLAEERSEQLHTSNKQLQERLKAVQGKDSKTLGEATEVERYRLCIERRNKRQEQNEILKAENQVHKATLEAAQHPDYHSQSKKRTGSEKDDGLDSVLWDGSSVEEQKHRDFFDQRRILAEQKAQELKRHRAEHRRILTETNKGRDVKALSTDIEEHRRLLVVKRQADKELQMMRLQQNAFELKSLKTYAKGKGAKALDYKIESYRSKLKAKRLQAQEEHRRRLHEHKEHLRFIKHRARPRSTKKQIGNSCGESDIASTTVAGAPSVLDKSTTEQTRKGVEMAPQVMLMTHGIFVKNNSKTMPGNPFSTAAAAAVSASSPDKKNPNQSLSNGSPTSVMAMGNEGFDYSYVQGDVASDADTEEIINSINDDVVVPQSLSVSMKRLQVAKQTHEQLQKHNATLLERLAQVTEEEEEEENEFNDKKNNKNGSSDGDQAIEEMVFFDC